MSQELLSARIKLLKVKSKSVESSPVSSPRHPPSHPIWQLSLQRSSKSSGQTDSDSSGTSSPILLSRTITPPPPPSPPHTDTQLTPSHSHKGGGVVGVAPRVVVTTSESSLKTKNLETHPESDSSHDSLFVDADDSRDSEISNLKSDGKPQFLNLNYDSIDTSESTHQEDEEMPSNISSSDSDVTVEPAESRPHRRKLYSSFRHSASKTPDTVSEDLGIVFGAGDETREMDESSERLSAVDEVRESGRAAVPSVLKEVLSRVHVHPTRVGLWRLQKGGCGHSLWWAWSLTLVGVVTCYDGHARVLCHLLFCSTLGLVHSFKFHQLSHPPLVSSHDFNKFDC